MERERGGCNVNVVQLNSSIIIHFTDYFPSSMIFRFISRKQYATIHNIIIQHTTPDRRRGQEYESDGVCGGAWGDGFGDSIYY